MTKTTIEHEFPPEFLAVEKRLRKIIATHRRQATMMEKRIEALRALVIDGEIYGPHWPEPSSKHSRPVSELRADYLARVEAKR